MGYELTREGMMGLAYSIVREKVNVLIHFRTEVLQGPGLKAS